MNDSGFSVEMRAKNIYLKRISNIGQSVIRRVIFGVRQVITAFNLECGDLSPLFLTDPPKQPTLLPQLIPHAKAPNQLFHGIKTRILCFFVMVRGPKDGVRNR